LKINKDLLQAVSAARLAALEVSVKSLRGRFDSSELSVCQRHGRPEVFSTLRGGDSDLPSTKEI
jgi:hypothetical protein